MAGRFRGAACVLGCLAVLGCKVGPDYERPPVVMPKTWRDGKTAEASAAEKSIANVPWWDLFKDEPLRKLVTTALEQNRDLKIAIERIEESRATYGISKADLYPHLSLRALGGGLNPSDGSLTHTPESEGTDPTALFDASATFSWELDFFGRIRRAGEAQMALLLASEEARRAVAISLVADVAIAYVDLRGLDRRLAITQATLKSREENVEFARVRLEGNVSNEVDLRQAQAEYHRIKSQVYNLEKLIAQKENELSFLVGQNPGDIMRDRSTADPLVPPEVPAGLPAALLERRPDVRKAEMELMSATARIGEAKAALYPSIKLTGSYGLASTDLTQLVDPASQSWNIFAGLLQPIFAGGALRGKVEVRESQQRQSVYAYERTLLQALREVEDSLISLRKVAEQLGELKQRATAERQAVELADARYRGGVSNYSEVLDAQRSLFNAEIDESMTTSEHTRSLIQLYKALGGGWPVPGKDGAAPTAPPAAPPAPTAPTPASEPAAPAPAAPAPAAPAPAPANPG